MASYLVPPHGSCIVKCRRCNGIYLPKKTKRIKGTICYEKCPFCGCSSNNFNDNIPIWKYNLIKFFRSGKRCEDIENHIITFEFEKNKER